MVVISFKPRRRTASVALIDRPEIDRSLAEPDELDAPIEREAGRVRLHQAAGADELAESAGSLEELYARVAGLEEGAYWEPEKHPRWPKDAPGGLGGQFMRVGQRFELHGVEYDVAAVMPGKVWANVATMGQHEKAAVVEFSSAQLAKATRPPAVAVKGAGPEAEATKAITATVIDAYVHSETHDPSIPIPEGSTVKPEEWQRFGKLDQERYSQLMERYGAFKASETQSKINAAYSGLDTESQGLLDSAYSQQYYAQSPGFSLSLHSIFKGVLGFAKGDSKLEQTRLRYEKTKAAQSELAGLLQWDLYNRTRAPDLAIFKGHSNNQLFTTGMLKNGVPVYAGASFSQHFRKGFFGGNKFMTPMAIRNIAMATVAAYATPTHAYHSEQEIAMADPWLADPKRTLNVADGSQNYDTGTGSHPGLSSMQATWLEKITTKGQSGAIIEQLLDSYKDGGASLPVPPQPPSITMDSAGGPQYQTPPTDAMKFAMIGDKKVSVLELPYDQVESGHPVAKKVKDMVDAGELHPGDYIEGMKGTRYVVVLDPSDSYLGLAYYKITDTGNPVEGTVFKAETGQDSQAFEGHTLFSGTEAYPFEGGGAKAFKKLKGHYELPTVSEEKTGFFPEAWAEGGKDDEKFTSKFAEGEKFIVHGVPYEVVVPGNAQVKIKNLDTGKLGKINGDTKLAPLQLKAGFNEQGAAYLTGDDFLEGPTVELGAALEQLAPGRVFLVGQTLWKIGQVTGDGHVVATVAGMSHPPAEHELKSMGKEHTFGADQKVSLMLDKPPGWEPAQVGDTTGIGGDKATVTKLLKDGTVQLRLAKGGVVKLKPNDAQLAYLHRPAAWQLGDKTKLSSLAVGERFHGGAGETIRPYAVVEQLGKQTQVRNLDTGEVVQLSSGKSYARLVPVQTAASVEPVADHATPAAPGSTFDPAQWEPAEKKTAALLELGEKFTVLGQPYEVIATSKGDSDDLGVAKNLATGQTSTYSKTYTGEVTTLQLKQSPFAQPPVPDVTAYGKALVPGDVISYKDKDYTVGSTPEGKAMAFEVGGIHAVTIQPDKTYFLVKKAAPAAVSPAPAAGTVLFDPAAYNEQDSPAATIGTLAPGAIFKGKSGAYMQIKKVSGKNVYAVNLVTGKPTKLAASIKPAKLMVPKAESETPYDELTPTDPVKLGVLKQGDQFHAYGGLYEVVKPAAGDEDNVTVAPVAPDGTLGVETDVGSHPLLKVTLYAKKADTLEISAPGMEKLVDAHGEDATDTHEEVAAVVAAAGLQLNDGMKTLAELDLQPGDTYAHKPGGETWKVVATNEAGVVSAINLDNGNTTTFGPTYVPHSWQKGAGDESDLFVPEMPTIPSSAETGAAPGKTLENTIPLGQLALGTEFSFAAKPGATHKSGIVFKLSAKSGSGKSVSATVVSSTDPAVDVGAVVGFKGDVVVPDFIGAEGAHAAPPPAATEKPTPITAPTDPADYVEVGKGTLGDVTPGGFIKTAVGVIYHVDSKNDEGGSKLTVVATPPGSLMQVGEYTDGAASITAVTIVKPKAPPEGAQPGGKLLPSEAKVGDHIIAGLQGQEFEITQLGDVGSGGVVSAKLKNVATGVEGSGYYTDGTADWMKAPNPSAEAPSGPKIPEPGAAKKINEFEIGQTVTKGGWAGGVYRLIAIDEKTATLQVVKPTKNQAVGAQVKVGYSWGSQYSEFPGGPMWKPGEYAKVVKPGNVSGKTGIVVGYDGDKVKVRHTDGKQVSVPESWLRWIQPQYKTTQALKPPAIRASGLEVGDIFSPGGYYSTTAYVVDQVNEDGSVASHAWGKAATPGYTTKTIPAATKVIPLVVGDMEIPAPPATPAATSTTKSWSAEKTVGKIVYPSQLEVGDTFTMKSTTGGETFKYQVTSTKSLPSVPGSGETMLGLLGLEGDVGSTYEQAWTGAETKDSWIYAGKAPQGTPMQQLQPGDVFAFHDNGAFLYQLVSKNQDGTVTYKSMQTGETATTGITGGVFKDEAATAAAAAAPEPVEDKIKAGIADVLGPPTPEPIEAPSSLIPEKTPGSPVGLFGDLQPGDVFETAIGGGTFRVDEAKPLGGGVIELTLTKLAGPGQHPVGGKITKAWLSAESTDGSWHYAEAPAAVGEPVEPSTGPLSDVLTPYLWPKSGKKKFPQLASLAPGTKFRDKTGKTYTVKGKGASGYVHYTDEAGQEYAAPASSRVFVPT